MRKVRRFALARTYALQKSRRQLFNSLAMRTWEIIEDEGGFGQGMDIL